jgi:uncharacterized protein (TIGR01777 family)
MNIVVLGGTGFIGTQLIKKLALANHQITLLSRTPALAKNPSTPFVDVKQWDYAGNLSQFLEGADAVINLAGESIGSKRWSKPQKERILSSRVTVTRAIVQAIGQTARRPTVLLNASGIGYYGHVAAGDVTEDSSAGHDFLSEVCTRWEEEAWKAEKFGVRVVLLRSGLVLAENGGSLQRLMLPFRLYVGGPLGTGQQWFPWIHLDDEVAAIVFCLEHSEVSGPANLVSPQSVTMNQFCTSLGKAMRRPSWLRVPSFVLKAAMGEMAEGLVLGGQKAIPQKLVAKGFAFKYQDIDTALEAIVR